MSDETYERISAAASNITFWLTFAIAYIYCMATYGFLFGFGLGWLPSYILGLIAGIAAAFLWPILVLAAVGLAIFLLTLEGKYLWGGKETLYQQRIEVLA
jgi:hypothetical protein